jgi:hypothetical protein
MSLAAALPVGRITRRASLLIAYAIPAIASWALLGLVLNLGPLSQLAVALVVAYGAYYGFIEATSRRGLPAPGRQWQVPAKWVINVPARRRIMVWGALLGPGFATPNPYAAFGLLPLLIASMGRVSEGVAVAVTVGLLHSASRAMALFRDVRDIDSADYMHSVLKSIHWRTIDGLELLVVTGVAIMVLLLHQ